MSLDDHQESAYVFRALMKQVKREIEQGERKGATVLYSVKGGKSLWERMAIRQQWKSLIQFRKRA